jgi:curved DNA-binding protein CbpA
MPAPDHYSVLGVLPTADDVVIRAAYRALAQRYHPDKWRADPKEATEKMAEINAAYSILSDAEKRREYDQEQRRFSESEPYFGANGIDEEPVHDPLLKKWQIATSVYPDLVTLDKSLATYSWRVASAFRAYLLETKDFENRITIAAGIEREYLERYFGKNVVVQKYAKKLLYSGHKAIALELNKIVSVLGSNADHNRIISFIEAKFQPFPDILRPIPDREEDEYYKKYPL